MITKKMQPLLAILALPLLVLKFFQLNLLISIAANPRDRNILILDHDLFCSAKRTQKNGLFLVKIHCPAAVFAGTLQCCRLVSVPDFLYGITASGTIF